MRRNWRIEIAARLTCGQPGRKFVEMTFRFTHTHSRGINHDRTLLGIDVHKTESQVAVLDELGKPVEEVRVFDANLDEIAEKYAGSEAAIEAGSNYFTIYDRLNEHLDVTLANPAKADWFKDQKQKDDRKDAKNLARFLRMNEMS